MASAQVKSAVLLAAMYADGETSVTEPAPTRDHTERMLKAYGYDCEVERVNEQITTVKVQGGGKLVANDIDVPADIIRRFFYGGRFNYAGLKNRFGTCLRKPNTHWDCRHIKSHGC